MARHLDWVQRTPKEIGQAAAVPLLGRQGLPAKAQSFRRVLPVLPLALSHSVSPLLIIQRGYNEDIDPQGETDATGCAIDTRCDL